MNIDDLSETISSSIAREICHGSLGSPYALSRLARLIRQVPGPMESLASVQGVSLLTSVARLLFFSRNPAADCKLLIQQRKVTAEGAAPEVFTLCAGALLQAAFRHDWNSACLRFDAALECVAKTRIPMLREAVIGLNERYALLPSTGSGVRKQGAEDDLLWKLNLAEEHFCQGRVFSAQRAAESLLTCNADFGWARMLLVRILFAQADFDGARSTLSASPVGSVSPVEELGWDTLLWSMTAGWDDPLVAQTARLRQQCRLPDFFDGLNWLLRGVVDRGKSRLQTSFRAGEPSSLMMRFDPVVRFAIGSVSESNLKLSDQGVSPSALLVAEV